MGYDLAFYEPWHQVVQGHWHDFEPEEFKAPPEKTLNITRDTAGNLIVKIENGEGWALSKVISEEDLWNLITNA